MKRVEWQKLSAEVQKEILEDLKENWPRFKNTHPRQLGKGKSTRNGWREYKLEDFISLMNMPLYLSWNDFQNEYNRVRREERLKDMAGFLENYSKTQPLAAKMVEELLSFYRRPYEEVNKMIRMVLDFFPPANWPFRRGEEE